MLTQLASNTKDSLPLFDFKDTKKSGHDKFKNWFGNLSPWLEVQMQRHLQSIENYPSEVMKFDWLYVDPEKHSTVLSYPTEKPVPPRLGPPNTQAVMLARAKQRKVRRAYNHKIVSLRQAAQQILWTSLINGTPPRLEHWRTWSMNYLLNHGAQPDAWTLEGFLSLGAEHSESQAVTSKSASSRHGQDYRASVNFTQPSRGLNKRANRGGRGAAIYAVAWAR